MYQLLLKEKNKGIDRTNAVAFTHFAKSKSKKYNYGGFGLATHEFVGCTDVTYCQTSKYLGKVA